ncbi:MAG: hypothetical protein ACLGI2_08295 [Acidimicrobiia bacterium]
MTASLPRRASVRWRRVASAVAAAALVAVAPAAPAAAQGEGSCPTDGVLSPVEVRVTSPGRGATVTGPSVTVRGSASALLAELTRVEVTFGDQSVARNYSPGSPIDFELTVDASAVAAGPTSVRVVACSSSVRGEDRFTVTYQPRAAAATTTSPARPATTSVSSPGAATGATTTTAGPAAGPAVANGATAPTSTTPGQTTVANQPTTTVAAPDAPAPAAANRPQPVRPGTNVDGNVVLSDSPDEGSSRPPLWVGAVVGLSGGIGLLFSATTWRRRHQVPPLEPVDPELVEVG